jgi:uncharacterized protein YlxP (DUF503 family)
MTSLGRAECRTLAEELQTVIQRAVNKYGLTVSEKGGQYSGATATLKFEVAVPAMAESRANSDAKLLGAEFSVGDTFTSRGDEYTVTGFALNRRKYPVSASRTSDGKQFKFTVGSISRAIAQ